MKEYNKPELIEESSIALEGVYAGSGEEITKPSSVQTSTLTPAKAVCPKDHLGDMNFSCISCPPHIKLRCALIDIHS